MVTVCPRRFRGYLYSVIRLLAITSISFVRKVKSLPKEGHQRRIFLQLATWTLTKMKEAILLLSTVLRVRIITYYFCSTSCSLSQWLYTIQILESGFFEAKRFRTNFRLKQMVSRVNVGVKNVHPLGFDETRRNVYLLFLHLFAWRGYKTSIAFHIRGRLWNFGAFARGLPLLRNREQRASGRGEAKQRRSVRCV